MGEYASLLESLEILAFLVSCVHRGDVGSAATKPVSNASLTIEELETTLAPHYSKVTGRSLFQTFLNRLWSIDCLYALHKFFTELGCYLTQSRQGRAKNADIQRKDATRVLLSPVSPIGVFLRRSQLEFARLQFEDSVKLWVALVHFRGPAESSWRRMHPSAPLDIPDVNMSTIEERLRADLSETMYGNQEENAGTPSLTTDEIERILEFQLERLQKFGNRTTEDMRSRLRDNLAQISSTPNLLHFVRFFDAWRAGDYSRAFENLHRYFDYTMQARDKSYYQYALLHMAILQADFGLFGEAFAAMNETIATARENQDISCLNFSMSWLDHLSKAYPKELERAGYTGMLGSEREGLTFLKAKAKEMKMWNLVSSTILSEAKAALSTGGDVRLALEQVYQSGHLNLIHNLQSNVGTQLLMQSSIYGRLGFGQLSDGYCEVLLDAYREKSPMDELTRASCRRAFNATHAGQHTDAVKYLASIENDVGRTLKYNQYIASCSRVCELKRNITRERCADAQNLLVSLQSGASSEPDITSQITLLEIEWQIQLGNLDQAFSLISTAAESMRGETVDLYQQMHLLVLKALLFARAGIPEKGFSIAVRVASASVKAKILPALWEAVGVLSNILNELGETAAASGLLDAVLPQALPGT